MTTKEQKKVAKAAAATTTTTTTTTTTRSRGTNYKQRDKKKENGEVEMVGPKKQDGQKTMA